MDLKGEPFHGPKRPLIPTYIYLYVPSDIYIVKTKYIYLRGSVFFNLCWLFLWFFHFTISIGKSFLGVFIYLKFKLCSDIPPTPPPPQHPTLFCFILPIILCHRFSIGKKKYIYWVFLHFFWLFVLFLILNINRQLAIFPFPDNIIIVHILAVFLLFFFCS